MTETGIDISHHNGTINWSIPKPINFVYAKCTESDNFLDSQYYNNMEGAFNLGLKFAPYHFARVEASPVSSARYFKAKAQWEVGMLPPMLDIELNKYGYSASHNHSWVHAFADELGIPEVIYTGNWFWTPQVVSGHCPTCSPKPSWWGPDHPDVPTWDVATIKQSYGATIPGISGGVDFDTITHGTLQDLIDYAAGGATPTQPTSPEEDEMIFVGIARLSKDWQDFKAGDTFKVNYGDNTYSKIPNPAILKQVNDMHDRHPDQFKVDKFNTTDMNRFGREVKWGSL